MPHRQVVLAIPKRLRAYCLYRRRLLGEIARVAASIAGRCSGVGKRLRPAADSPWFTIVGVVSDVRDSSIARPPISEVWS